jgi:hypothetical protein
MPPFYVSLNFGLRKVSYISGAIVDPLFGGLIISCCVSYFLLRFFDKIPTKNPILKSVVTAQACVA